MNNADAQLATCYGPVSQAFVDRAAKIRLLILDVDGVLSDGLIYMGNHGEELKAFNVRDGYGIRCALTSGIEVAIITGRKAKLVEDRCQTLGITHLYQGQSDKLLAFRDLTDKLHVRPEEVAYIGDDLIDWPVMAEVGLSVAVADAHPLLLPRANYVTRINGGRGAVREVCDLLLLAQGKLDEAKGAINMSKTRRWVIILLSLLALILIGLNLANTDDTAQPEVNPNDPTYKSEHTDTVVYSPEGALSYRLIAEHVEYFSDQEVSWFTKPVMTTFDTNKVPTWSVRADKAKLTNDRMLYLYGHVEVNALAPDSQLRKITTDNAQINLVTQDVTSDDMVTLYGTTFNSSGLKMRGNLRSKNAELIEKVRTSYEIQNKQTQP